MKLALAIVLTIAKALAFFSFVCPQVLLTQPRMILLTAYVPTAKTHMEKYLAPVLSVAQPSTKPKMATALAAVMCQVRSLKRPLDQDQAILMAPAIRYGGQVSTRVIVSVKPRVSTAVGKKFLNPLAARCICCMKANNQTLGSEAASFRPATVLVLDLPPTVSDTIRPLARSRSSGLSHQVCVGSFGSTNADAIAITKVMMPSKMKSLLAVSA